MKAKRNMKKKGNTWEWDNSKTKWEWDSIENMWYRVDSTGLKQNYLGQYGFTMGLPNSSKALIIDLRDDFISKRRISDEAWF